MSVDPRCYFGEMALMISDWTSCFRLDPSDEQTVWLSPIWSPILGDEVVGHVEDTLCTAIRDGCVEQPKLIAFPGERTSRKISTLSIIVVRCGVTDRPSCRHAINHIHHPDQCAG